MLHSTKISAGFFNRVIRGLRPCLNATHGESKDVEIGNCGFTGKCSKIFYFDVYFQCYSLLLFAPAKARPYSYPKLNKNDCVTVVPGVHLLILG